MKSAQTKATVYLERKALRRAREIDPALLRFVEALAIADARRDHLLVSRQFVRTPVEVAGERRSGNGGHDETRSDLRSVLDRASERKID
jgi:hypothetical protein